MKRALAVLVFIALAGCGGSAEENEQGAESAPPTATKYASLDALAEAVTEAGADCADYTATNLTLTGDGAGECADGTVLTWYDAESADYRERLGQELRFVESVVTRGPALVGPNWIVEGDAASDLMDAMGGEVVTSG